MSKETSEEIASLAGELAHIQGKDLHGLTPEQADQIASKIRRVSMSAVVQREADED